MFEIGEIDSSRPLRLLIVGNPVEYHLGSHLQAAAESLGWSARIADVRDSWSSNRWINRVHHHLLGRRPSKLAAFGQSVIATCQQFQPHVVISTGIAPLSADVLKEIGRKGIVRVNYLTDDPWSRSNRAAFFFQSLKEYDVIANPRRANIEQLKNLGCRQVQYVPFGYNPSYHFIETDPTPAERARFTCDASILGGADDDRVPLALSLVDAGLNVALYGIYWDKYPRLRKYHRGYAHGRDLRLAVQLANCHVCMGRKANRDGHAMRSLEFPAMGACLVTEDTSEHRDLYGDDGEAVLYWNDEASLVNVTRRLVEQKELREQLTKELFQRIVGSGKHTYATRLQEIILPMLSG